MDRSADEMIADSMRKHSTFNVAKTEIKEDEHEARVHANRKHPKSTDDSILWLNAYDSFLDGRRSAR